MGTRIVEVFGRDSELRSIGSFLDAPFDAPAGLVLEGDPGIGKSTLWNAAVEAARDRGFHVLVSRPAEAERGLALMGLGDLLDPVLDQVLHGLNTPRRRALEAALLRDSTAGGEDGEGEVDERALVVAVRDALALLSEHAPVVVAIDDVQWLDASSVQTLAAALRRAGSAVRVILARRLEPSELEQAVDSEHVAVGPLAVGPLHALLRSHVGRSFAHQTLARIQEQSAGNPFFALELARVVEEDPDPLAPSPIPPTLAELMRVRLTAIPDATRDALAFAAALGTPSVSLLADVGVDPDALDPAIAAHVIERTGGVIRFTHPLLSSVLYGDLGERRREVHARIAAAVSDPVMRSRHLALSTDEPDAAVASALEDAARVAADRGASAAAAELAEAALRLTPRREADERRRRALGAARAEREAGEWTRARRLAEDLLASGDLGTLRADVLFFLAEFEGLGRAVILLEEALREAASRPALQAEIQCRLAWTTRLTEGFDAALVRARAALEMAEKVDDDALRVEALQMVSFLGGPTGDPETAVHSRRAYDLAVAIGDERLIADALMQLVESTGSDDEARRLLLGAYESMRDLDEPMAAEVLRSLATLELDCGRWRLATDYAEHALELHVQYGMEAPWMHIPYTEILADLGRLDEARAHCERALQLAQEQFGFPMPMHQGTMGVILLRRGDPRGALDWFEQAGKTAARLGWRDAFSRWWVPDQVEALLAVERPDDADRLLDGWNSAQHAWEQRTRAHALRCRGLIASARGDVTASVSFLEDAVATHERAADSFGRARSLLALGVSFRRLRRKRDAAEAIFAALGVFEQLGAATWIEDARAELGRLGGRTRTEGLTPAEHRVAALVAQGRTNQEVAAALFLRIATVETHLIHVYAKLGVRSRTELSVVYRPDQSSKVQRNP